MCRDVYGKYKLLISKPLSGYTHRLLSMIFVKNGNDFPSYTVYNFLWLHCSFSVNSLVALKLKNII